MEKQLTFGQRAQASLVGFLRFLWNNKTKEFLGRDGASWAKISFFYGIFYLILAGCFIGMLAVVRTTIDPKIPTYYGKTSVMGIAKDFESGKKNVNPALGFRPQFDPESPLIIYSMSKLEDPAALSDFARINKSLANFLERYYHSNETDNQIENCQGKNPDEVLEQLNQNKYCPFDYKKVSNMQDGDDPFGYTSSGPLVFLKLNKIYKWLPQAYDFTNLPSVLNTIKNGTTNADKLAKLEKIVKENVIVKCEGEYAADKDALNGLDVTYYSIGEDAEEFNKQFGIIPHYYYPYMNQNGYQSPLIFVKFNYANTSINKNRVVNVLCKAYAANIDSDDKLNRRGMTQFVLYVKN